MIIIDNKEENIEELIMVDDGMHKHIKIPVILINKQDGQLIKKYIMNEEIKTEVLITIFFKGV